MVNPGSFQGLRKKFLDDQQEFYAAAVRDKHIADAVADIQRRYFKRFPLTLSHTQEPSEEFLATVDDDAPDPELLPPQKGTLSDEAYARDCRVYEFQVAELKMRQAVCTLPRATLNIFLTHILFSKSSEDCITSTPEHRERRLRSKWGRTIHLRSL